MVQIINNLLQKIEGRVEASAFTSKEQMKGLTKFITDIRLCKSREAEIKRVNKELANIRNKFRTDKNIDGYHRKKYIAKLILIFLLGYDVTIGQSEAAFLLSSNKLSEKQIGYLFLSLLSDDDDNDLKHILINCLISDLRSVKYYNILLAVNCIQFCINDDMVKEISPVLHELLMNTSPENSEYQLFLNCCLSFIKYDRQYITRIPDIFKKILKLYVNASDLNLLPLTNIIYESALINGDAISFLFPTIIDHLFKISRITSNSPLSYYNIISPWAIIKSLQLLQLLNPTNDYSVGLSKLLSHIFAMENPLMSNVSTNKKTHYSNILNAVKFEAVSVVASKIVNENCLNQTYNYLSRMLSSAETNHRFLFLENLVKMKHTQSFQYIIKDFSKRLSDLIASEKNSGLRLQAVSVIYSVGDLTDSKKIVENMIKFLMNAEFCIREELALKICAIASKNISDAKWYIDSMISVLLYGREFTGEEVWFKISQTVSQHKNIQEYAVKTLFTYLNHPNSSEFVAKLGVYLIGEYGHFICKLAAFSSQSQYSLVMGLFPFHSVTTKHVILTALVKMAFNQPTLKQQISDFFDNDMVTQNIDTELQQRACEYRQLLTKDQNILQAVLEAMPVFEYTDSDECENETIDTTDKNISTDVVSSATDLLFAEEPVYSAESSNQILSTSGGDLVSFQTTNSYTGALQESAVNAAFLKKFLFTNSGILYEDQEMTVKLASKYNKSMGSHEIRLESIDPYNHLKVVNFTTPESSNVMFSSFTPECSNVFSGGCSINFQTISVSPLSSNVSITIHLKSSSDQQNVKKKIFVLPIDTINYMIPYTIESTNFVSIWNSMASPELERVEVFEASRVVDKNFIFEQFKYLNMAILVGIDPNHMNIVTASAFYCQSFVAGCITRLETQVDSAMMRLTVRSKLAELTSAISKKIISLL